MSGVANAAAFAAIVAVGLVLHATGGAHSILAWRVTLVLIAAGSALTALAMLWLDRRRG
ncbi:hypothetical protein GXW74_24070 [Roseomonas eburnea]|uniref:Uncharacterized protein n=1 Tax=Neoroseomonas eburnea TaxID=1346889 RepID=A0A9X9XIP7_9PROT|nr:hypothetical protein [Neoroseomonas eburnea]MBR0683583.1 hypothetical protein [Neoroseomonas eburnea]